MDKYLPDKGDALSFVTEDAGLALATGRVVCRISVAEGFCWALSVQ